MVRKLLGRSALRRRVETLRRTGKRIVFTNGCFDLLHPGHVRCLRAAKRLGDVLVVGVNTDASVRRLGKGAERPIMGEQERAEVLAALEMVDYVSLFDEDTPLELIRAVRPDVLVKGGDWSVQRIAGADFVRSYGGKVKSLPLVPGFSTSQIVERIRTNRKSVRQEKPGGGGKSKIQITGRPADRGGSAPVAGRHRRGRAWRAGGP